MITDWIRNLRTSVAKVGPIGMEFAHEGVNAVQLCRHSSGAIVIKDYISIPYPENFDLTHYSPQAFSQLIVKVLKKRAFSGRKINTVMPSSELKIISVNYHAKKGQSEVEAITEIVSDRVDGDLHDHVVDYLPVRNEKKIGNGLAIVALAKKDKVIEYLECLRKSGLTVEGLEVGPSAIRRLISSLYEPTDAKTVLVVNFGSQKSFLSVVSGRRLLFDDSIDFGEDMVLNHLENSLSIDKNLAKSQLEQHGLGKISEADNVLRNSIDEHIAIAMEQILKPEFKKITHSIQRSAMYASSLTHGSPLTQIYMLGSLARWRGADRIFSELLGMDVNLIPNPLIAFGVETDEESHTIPEHNLHDYKSSKPELAVATGLAMKGLLDHG